MDFFKNNRNKLMVAFALILSFNVIKCANQAHRHGLLPGVGLDGDNPFGNEAHEQVTTLTDLIDNSEASNQFIAKEIFIKPTFTKLLNESLNNLSLPIEEYPWDVSYNLFLEQGFISPPEDDPDRFAPFRSCDSCTRIHVVSNQAVDGIRYVNAGFNVLSNDQGRGYIEEKFMAFELEKFDGNFETAIDFLKEAFLGEDAEPCFDTLQDHVVFSKDDWIIEVIKETEDTIRAKLNDEYPQRSMEDVGSVGVSISQGGHYHHLEGTCVDEHEEH